jgi:hypothetical protein
VARIAVVPGRASGKILRQLTTLLLQTLLRLANPEIHRAGLQAATIADRQALCEGQAHANPDSSVRAHFHSIVAAEHGFGI